MDELEYFDRADHLAIAQALLETAAFGRANDYSDVCAHALIGIGVELRRIADALSEGTNTGE